MPGRRVFFSFHYERDVWRAANLRQSGAIDAKAAAGWRDSSLWEAARRKGEAEIRRLIDGGLVGTSVTAVLIGTETSERRWVNYEIEKSIERGNGLFGIRIHRIKDQDGRRSREGKVPSLLKEHRCPVYDWERGRLGMWAEWAAVAAGKACIAHQEVSCRRCRRPWWY